jgi:hypothetical protein
MTGYRSIYRFRAPQWEGESKSEYNARQRQWRYEESVVKHMIDRLKLPHLRRELWAENKRNSYGDFGRLTLEDFSERTDMPVCLGAKRIDTRRPPSIHKLFRDLLRTPMGAAFVEVMRTASSHAADLPAGVVFTAPRAKFMTLHTYPSTQRPGKTRIVIPLKRPKGTMLILESLDDLLASLGPMESWSDSRH